MSMSDTLLELMNVPKRTLSMDAHSGTNSCGAGHERNKVRL